MKPTNKLRWVEREVKLEYMTDMQSGTIESLPMKQRVLQQWWEYDKTKVLCAEGWEGKWRDVPVEKDYV